MLGSASNAMRAELLRAVSSPASTPGQSGTVRWFETRRVRPHVNGDARRAPLGLVIGSLIAGWLFSTGSVVAATTLALATVLAPQATYLSPTFRTMVRRFAESLGAAASWVLLTVAWVALLPIWLVLRIVRWNPVAAGGSRHPGWIVVGTTRTATTRAFQLERWSTGVISRAHGLGAGLAVVAAVGLIGVGAAKLSGRTVTRDFLESPVERPEEPWVIAAGIPVSQESFPNEPWGAEVIELGQTIGTSAPGGPYRWHLIDAESEHINIVAGRRVTRAVTDPEATVWVFGGSTVFGAGQRDDHTIPSALVGVAAEAGRRVQFVNLGVPAFVNWQETLMFEDLLADGGRPDLAIFYDGCNEMALATERERYGRLDPSVPQVLTVSEEEREELDRAVDRRGYVARHDNDRRAMLAATQYRHGVERARAAADRAGVKVVHVWQPGLVNVTSDQPMVDEVRAHLEFAADYPRRERDAISNAIRKSGVNPIDLTDSLREVDVPLFFDACHTNEAGARLQAEAIYGVVSEHLPDGS